MDKSIRDKYTVVIGLEVHAQMLTNSKAYSSDSTEFGTLPNTNVSVITMGMPGTLPKINKKVVDYAIKMGLACNCTIREENIYARKNYFYPDLPKGYQITQDKTPICHDGYVTIDKEDGEMKIGITRIHMEEDAGKSIHIEGEADTLVDYNRAGVALIEIVSEPDMRTSDEAYLYLQEIRKIVRYLEICDGNMEEGSLRCDANVSVMLKDAKEFGTKVEIKNMNSFRNVQRAIEYEVIRQIELCEKGEEIDSDTRSFNAVDGTTFSMRSKENLNDYRYFPEPDLPPLYVSEEWVEKVKLEMPILPRELFKKFISEYKIPEYDAKVLTDSKEIAQYFEEICHHTKNYKATSNWMMGAVKSYLNELTLHIKDFPLKPNQIAEIIQLIDDGKISNSTASQKVFPELVKEPSKTALKIAEENNLIQQSDEGALKRVIEGVLNENPNEVERYKSGQKQLLGMFMGKVMKASGGKADPKKTNELLQQLLEN